MKSLFILLTKHTMKVKRLLVVKANLAEMTRLGLPIPQGFTITTRCCMDYLADAFFEEHLQSEILKAVKT